MSLRILKVFTLLDEVDANDAQTSDSTDVEALDKIMYSIKVTGTAAGTYQLQVSTDNEDWFDFDSAITADASTGKNLVHINRIDFKWIRFTSPGAGTGTMTVTINGSQFGGS